MHVDAHRRVAEEVERRAQLLVVALLLQRLQVLRQRVGEDPLLGGELGSRRVGCARRRWAGHGPRGARGGSGRASWVQLSRAQRRTSGARRGGGGLGLRAGPLVLRLDRFGLHVVGERGRDSVAHLLARDGDVPLLLLLVLPHLEAVAIGRAARLAVGGLVVALADEALELVEDVLPVRDLTSELALVRRQVERDEGLARRRVDLVIDFCDCGRDEGWVGRGRWLARGGLRWLARVLL